MKLAPDSASRRQSWSPLVVLAAIALLLGLLEERMIASPTPWVDCGEMFDVCGPSPTRVGVTGFAVAVLLVPFGLGGLVASLRLIRRGGGARPAGLLCAGLFFLALLLPAERVLVHAGDPRVLLGVAICCLPLAVVISLVNGSGAGALRGPGLLVAGIPLVVLVAVVGGGAFAALSVGEAGPSVWIALALAATAVAVAAKSLAP